MYFPVLFNTPFTCYKIFNIQKPISPSLEEKMDSYIYYKEVVCSK